MFLVFGGAYQGKLDYSLKTYKKGANEVFHCSDGLPEIDLAKEVINGIHLFMMACIKNGIDIQDFWESNLDKLKDKVLICDDISCGIVPMVQDERLWREEVSRSLTFLANHSAEVTRVFCGLGLRLR